LSPDRRAAALVIGLSVAACASSANRALTPIPPLATGGRGGAVAMPAIGVPSPGAIVYRIAGPLPTLPSHATVYRADATTTPPRVARLAGAFGLSGSVREDASGWAVDVGDRSLHVQRAGGLPWTFSFAGGGSVSSGCAVASPESTGGSGAPSAPSSIPSPTCPPTTTAPGLPTKAGAEQRAREVLARAGFDLTGVLASSTGSADSWSVTFAPTMGTLPVLGGQWSVTIGADGTILSASGLLVDPVAVGNYPLVGVDSGVQRLEEGGKWIVYRGPVPMLGQLTQRGPVPDTTGPATPGGAGGGPTAAAPLPPTGTEVSNPTESASPGGPAVPTSSCPPGQPCPPIPTTAVPVGVPPVVATITDVHLAVAWAWPIDPSSRDAWVVPVYVFELTGGTTHPFFGDGVPILAVADQHLVTPPSTGATEPGGVPSPNTPPGSATLSTN
jgi:hypothetical protein